MRKLYALLLTGFAFLVMAANQASAQNYTYTTSTGNAIVPGTTLVAGSVGDDVLATIALPFGYSAYNVVYNSVTACSNGNLQFTTTNNNWTNTCVLPDATMGVSFMPHWDDLRTDVTPGDGIYTSVSGVAPNRIFNIEWRAVYFSGGGTLNFEVRLFEGQQRVDYIYGTNTQSGSSATVAVQKNSPSLQTTFSCNTASLSSGLGISWLGPSCTGVPSPGFITGPSALLCSGTPVTLTLNGYTSAGGTTIQWKSSPTPGGPYIAIGGATNPTYSFNANAQAYFVATVTCPASGFSATSSEFTLNVDKPIHTVTAATPSTSCSPGVTTITGTVANGVLGTVTLASSGTINLGIPDNTPAGVNSTLAVPASTIAAASDMKIRINCTHTWVGDLKFKLTSPCGITYLFDQPGVPPLTFGNSDDLVGVYVFDLTAATVFPENASAGGFVPTGNYRPTDANGAAHNWAGLTFPCSTAGNWVLNVSDNAGGDVGVLIDWAIIRPGFYTHTLSGPGSIGGAVTSGQYNENVSFAVTNIPAGNQTYALTSTDGIGCSVTTNINVTVNTTPTISITGPTPPVNYAMTSSTGNSIVPGTTLVAGSQGDDVTAVVALPFTYQAYDNSYNSVSVGSNGNLQFTTTNTAFTNVCPLPTGSMGVAFFPHWDDMHTGRVATEGIYTSVSGVAPNRIFNIEWRAELFSPTSNAITVNFEARLYEGQQRVDFIYGNVQNNGASASIGVQNASRGLQTTYSCNSLSLSSGLGLSFTLPPLFTICAGDIQRLDATVTPSQPNYTVTSSAGNSIVPGTALVAGSQGDDVTAVVALPFTYQAYYNNYNSVTVSSNGNLQFTTANTAFTNACPLPTGSMGIAFFPHWDDMHTGRVATEGIYTSVSGVAPNRIFNIEWRAELFSPTSNAITVNFEARLYEGQQRVDFIYGNVQNNGVSASIGVQNAGGGLQTTYSCNSASLSSGLGLTFLIPPTPVTFSPLTELYTDPAATVAYTGTPVSTIYARPSVTRTYTASVTSAQGCPGSTSVTINVNQLPAITTQPVAAAAPVCPGYNVTYSLAATGAAITYQWQLSTDNGVNWSNILGGLYSGFNSPSLTVIVVSPGQNNYRYRCVVSGTCPPPAISNAVILTVASAPVIASVTTSPAVPTICANSNISFTVSTAGSVPAPTIFQWQVSTDNGVNWTNLTTGGSYTSVFTITGATTSMNGYRYRVIVTNNCNQSTTSSSVTLTVNPLPAITVTALSNRICISDSLVQLVATPVGGVWSGIGVSGTNFIPSATAVGTYTLTYTYTSALNCTNTATVVAKVEDCPERIRLLIKDAVILYPNPNNGKFNIKINSTLYNYLGMRVFTTSGQLVKMQSFNGLIYGRVIPIDLSMLPAGPYMVKFYYDDGIRTSEKTFIVVTAHN